MQVVRAETKLPQLQQQAQAAAAQVQAAQVQQKQQGQVYAQQAPQLLQHAEALLAPIRDCHAAAMQTAPRLQAMHKDLSQLKGLLMVRSSSRYASSNQCTLVELLFTTLLPGYRPYTSISYQQMPNRCCPTDDKKQLTVMNVSILLDGALIYGTFLS